MTQDILRILELREKLIPDGHTRTFPPLLQKKREKRSRITAWNSLQLFSHRGEWSSRTLQRASCRSRRSEHFTRDFSKTIQPHTIENACQTNYPLVSGQRVINVQLHSKRQANGKQTVCHNRHQRGEAPIGGNEGDILPVHEFGIAENAIDDPEGGFRIKISLIMLGLNGRVLVRSELEYRLVGSVTNAPELDHRVGGSLRAEVRLILILAHN